MRPLARVLLSLAGLALVIGIMLLDTLRNWEEGEDAPPVF